eukprot:snap_masked-scaffold_56-processed-gene-0.22-mRNA-1 protein AED:1.00 eAED:1.00 QI:0/0/0/0/1/1/3/0/63
MNFEAMRWIHVNFNTVCHQCQKTLHLELSANGSTKIIKHLVFSLKDRECADESKFGIYIYIYI